jgi:hypothetical protein
MPQLYPTLRRGASDTILAMPAYVAGPQNFTDLEVGVSLYLFSAEAPTIPAAGYPSIALTRAYSPGTAAGTTFQLNWATAPTATVDSIAIQGSNDGINWQTLYTSNAGIQQDNYSDDEHWAFYRAILLAESTGGALTVIAQR